VRFNKEIIMLQAQNGRQINLAADVVRKFLTSKQVDIKHSEALQLVSQLIGYPSYHAARAGLQGVAKGVATDTSTWRQLAHAIGTLSDEQLDMPVQVTEGCDENGNATFSEACELLMANADSIAAGATIFASNQPVLLIGEFDSPVEESDGSQADVAADEEEYRVGMQLECATDESASLAGWHIARKGLDDAIEYLNSEYGCNISLGEFVIYSEDEQGFWNADFGWVSNKASATGVEKMPNVPGFPSDVELVRYVDAVDVEESDSEPNVMDDKVQGPPVSRYSWPSRFEAIWSDVRAEAVKTCTTAAQIMTAEGFQVEMDERPHGANAGHELVMSIRKGGIYGGEMVLALANLHASSNSLPCAAGMNWFFQPPARYTLIGSILPAESFRKPFSTEAAYFKRLVKLIDAKQLAEFMARMFEPEQTSN
jgi:hypothetical protein